MKDKMDRSVSETTSVSVTQISYRFEKIDPVRAQAILDISPGSGRPLDTKAIATYAEAMLTGRFLPNGMTIILDGQGRLLDGYHRLEALVEAERRRLAATPNGEPVTFRTVVAYGFSADTLHTIDQHRHRSYTGVLEARLLEKRVSGPPGMAGSLIRLMTRLARIERGMLGKERTAASWEILDKLWFACGAGDELIEAVLISERFRSSPIPAGARAALVFMARRAGHGQAVEDFLFDLSSESQDVAPPIQALRLQMSFARLQKINIEVNQALGIASLAFQDVLDGERAFTPYSWTPDYGDVPRHPDGRIRDYRLLRESVTTPNLGLPLLRDWRGLPEIRNHRDQGGRVPQEIDARTTAAVVKQMETSEDREIRVDTRFVTPDIARTWLADYNTGNRRISNRHVESIARDILAGRWMVNGQPICFEGDPILPAAGGFIRLQNGQHRLKAILLAADTSFWRQDALREAADGFSGINVPVAVNVPSEAFATYDIHAKRSPMIEIDGDRDGPRVDPRVLAAAAKMLIDRDLRLGSRERTTRSVSAGEIRDTIDRHPDLGDGFAQARRMHELGSAGVLLYFMYEIRRENLELANEFLEKLENGAGLTRDDPLLRRRGEMIKARKEKRRKEVLDTLLATWEEWKAYRERTNKAKDRGLKRKAKANGADHWRGQDDGGENSGV